jgi:signal peptidase I
MARKRLIYTGFFVFLATQAIVFAGYFFFHAKGYGFATVEGISMLPTLKNGQTVVISSDIPEGNLTNAIVVFGDGNICHRCIKDEGQWLTFKGDNTSFSEHATRDELKAIFVKVSENPFLDSIILGFQ